MLDPHQICFIYSANNDALLAESMGSVNSLYIPGGYQVENRVIRNATSITQAYNQGMLSSHAKYKIYLHQDLLILNRNFLKELVILFRKYPRLGLLGIAGPKIIPPNAYWPDATVCFGRFLWGTGKPEETVPLAWHEVTGDYESVQAVDGIIMMTQYDLPWREDIFPGWHFYDISQSLEFIKAGFEVGIPRQVSPWFLHKSHDTSMANYETDKQIFLQHYGDMIVR
ncbi:MAG TPA: glycosyltransferase family protein [Bacillota bacterium]|nr:glycosyltransferase family protein [Bacillota bacterium]